MITITYIEADGSRHEVDVDTGMSLMEGATLNLVPGVEGMCGGIASCATCHCYIDSPWAELLAEPAANELDMLATASGRQANSRLGCQIAVTEAMAGMEVRLPLEQG